MNGRIAARGIIKSIITQKIGLQKLRSTSINATCRHPIIQLSEVIQTRRNAAQALNRMGLPQCPNIVDLINQSP